MIPMLAFDLRGIEVSLHGLRKDSPPKMIRIDDEIVVDTDEAHARLNLLHRNLQKYGTIYNTLTGATDVSGTIRRKGRHWLTITRIRHQPTLGRRSAGRWG